MNAQTEYHQVANAITILLTDISPGLSEQAIQVIKKLVNSISQQHSCLHLNHDELSVIAELLASPIASTGDVVTPLIIRGSQLYFHRYYELERKIAEKLRIMNQRSAIPGFSVGELDSLFPESQPFNMQKIAAYLAATRKLTIITGGPGTGKTSTVAKIISLMYALQPSLTFALAAPTGKAASRLSQSLQQTWAGQHLDHPLQVSEQVQTLHRLLGISKDSSKPRYHAGRKLDFDVLIIDEASMIDLAMMSNLLEAMQDTARLILLGDPGQLPSVETGNLLADLTIPFPGFSDRTRQELKQHFSGTTIPPEEPSQLTNAACRLTFSFRFSELEGIGKLANSIIRGDPEIPSNSEQVQRQDLSRSTLAQVTQPLNNYFQLMQQEVPLQRLFDELNQCKILTPTREGHWGVVHINAHIEQILESQNLKAVNEFHYHGRPIMILRNDYVNGLFNGDIGLCIDTRLCTDLAATASLDTSKQSSLVACFTDSPGLKIVPLGRLPEHETCFSMTVHKSQGSEFDQVCLVLAEAESEASQNLQTRELLYTAVTRCRSKISIFAEQNTWKQAIQRQRSRSSGLADFLCRPLAKR
ncbi:MAG TPA: exodeoxyribonuclease V subunit alpha [Gammaproteobacteria bacterium]|nr:exodeoxyribonuclease V subunit alpha [Gammaproteobacteria bacterium]HIK69178.1 exodeoxyribonuclease V subunit alpha [Pseudomonadales bacterium]